MCIKKKETADASTLITVLRESKKKNHCGYYSMFDISYTTAGCSDFTAQTACAATSVSNLFAASDKTKTSSHLFSPKDTLLLREESGKSFQQLQQQLHLAVVHSSAILSTHEII